MRLSINSLFYILIFGLLVSNCTRRPKEILKSSEMTKILVDIHIADGLFETQEYKFLPDQEKVNYYNFILVKHNTTLAQFDSSIVWYSSDPKKLENIYNKVVTELTSYEEDVKNGKYISLVPKDSLAIYAKTNLWNLSAKFEFNKTKNRDNLYFVVKDSILMVQDSYLLSFRQRIQPSDTCQNHKAVLYIHYADNKIDSISKDLHNDGKLRKYTLRLSASHNEGIDSLSVYLPSTGICSEVPQSIYVDSISLIRYYNPSIQEKLREKLNASPYLLFKNTKDYSFRIVDIE